MDDVETYGGEKVVADVVILTCWDQSPPGMPVPDERFGTVYKVPFGTNVQKAQVNGVPPLP